MGYPENLYQAFLVSRKLNRPIRPPLYMQNVQIEEVECHKHLGVCLSRDCSWHQHISYLKEKTWCRISVMRKLKYKLDRKSLETIYIAFIRPLLEYADVIWDNCTQYEKDDLEKIQIEAARIATGTTNLFLSIICKKKFAGTNFKRGATTTNSLFSIKCTTT